MELTNTGLGDMYKDLSPVSAFAELVNRGYIRKLNFNGQNAITFRPAPCFTICASGPKSRKPSGERRLQNFNEGIPMSAYIGSHRSALGAVVVAFLRSEPVGRFSAAPAARDHAP
ncbi:hypothetical protein ACMAZE_04365 [Pseudopelagicola sp. nBUS_20]|uniref:hypothetical protein n=1 Tax=Pseudopelagicola sp. nBUS_20 TaxID=3395317 RepID=UPI003EBC6A0D